MSDIDGFSAALRLQSERRQVEREELNKKLGEPAKFVPDDFGPEGHGTGYWKAQGGVISYRRYSNGYDQFSRVEYTSEFIDMLNEVNQ